MKCSLLAVLLSAPLVLAACDQKSASAPPAHQHAGNDHGGHDHATPESEGEAHGEEVALGAKKSGDFDISAVIGKGWEKAGEAHLEVKVTGGQVPAVRAWIGTQDGAGSVKAKLETEEDHFHGHVEVSAPVASEAQLWVEVEGAPAVGFDVGASR